MQVGNKHLSYNRCWTVLYAVSPSGTLAAQQAQIHTGQVPKIYTRAHDPFLRTNLCRELYTSI